MQLFHDSKTKTFFWLFIALSILTIAIYYIILKTNYYQEKNLQKSELQETNGPIEVLYNTEEETTNYRLTIHLQENKVIDSAISKRTDDISGEDKLNKYNLLLINKLGVETTIVPVNSYLEKTVFEDFSGEAIKESVQETEIVDFTLPLNESLTDIFLYNTGTNEKLIRFTKHQLLNEVNISTDELTSYVKHTNVLGISTPFTYIHKNTSNRPHNQSFDILNIFVDYENPEILTQHVNSLYNEFKEDPYFSKRLDKLNLLKYDKVFTSDELGCESQQTGEYITCPATTRIKIEDMLKDTKADAASVLFRSASSRAVGKFPKEFPRKLGIAYSTKPAIVLHELGHSVANLLDEYNRSEPEDEPRLNCVRSCEDLPEWAQSEDCTIGCNNPSWYRAAFYSKMKFPNYPFNIIAENQFDKVFDYYAPDKSVEIIPSEILAPSDNQIYTQVPQIEFAWTKVPYVDKYILEFSNDVGGAPRKRYTYDASDNINSKKVNRTSFPFLGVFYLRLTTAYRDKEVYRDYKFKFVSKDIKDVTPTPVPTPISISTPHPPATPTPINEPTIDKNTTRKVYVKATGSPKNGIYPQLELYINGKKQNGTFNVGAQDNLNSSGEFEFITDTDLTKSTLVSIRFVNDTSNDTNLNTAGNKDRNISLEYVKLLSEKLSFNEPDNRIVYDRANKEDGSLYNGYCDFGTSTDSKGQIKSGDIIYGNTKLTRQIFWNGGINIVLNGYPIAKSDLTGDCSVKEPQREITLIEPTTKDIKSRSNILFRWVVEENKKYAFFVQDIENSKYFVQKPFVDVPGEFELDQIPEDVSKVKVTIIKIPDLVREDYIFEVIDEKP